MKIEVNGNKPRFVLDSKSTLTSRSLGPQRRNSLPRCAGFAVKRVLNSPMYRSRRNRFASSRPVIPASGNS
jgi:hypothetical protein